MTRGTKKRMAIWAIISIVIVAFITVGSYNDSKFDTTFNDVFDGKTEEQVKMEMLELQNFEFESKPLYTVKDTDYQFDIFRAVEKELTNNYGFYIVGTNLGKYEKDGEEYFKTGTVDFMLYESTPDDIMAKAVKNIRLYGIEGTDLMVGYLEFTPTDAKDYSLIIDCSRCNEAFGKDYIDARNLSDMYDVTAINSAKALRENGSLKAGYAGDIEAAGYAKADWKKVGTAFVCSLVVVGGVAALSFYTLEREVFNKKRK